MELRPGSVVNLGIGIPEGVANVAAEEHILGYLTLTAEPGADGRHAGRRAGFRLGGRSRKPSWTSRPSSTSMTAAVSTPRSWAWLRRTGWAMPTSADSVRLAGSGGFINISQNAKRLVFVGTFVVPSRNRVQHGRLVIADGAVAPKFLTDVEQRTFSGDTRPPPASRAVCDRRASSGSPRAAWNSPRSPRGRISRKTYLPTSGSSPSSAANRS